MKNTFLKLHSLCAVVALLLLTSLASSCSDHDDEALQPLLPEEPTADYTVIMYATGGGDLDNFLEYNLSSVEKYGYTPKVQFSAMVKFSKDHQAENGDDYAGTRLFTLKEDGFDNVRVADNDFRMDNPQNLADYITQTMQRLPAKKYILLLWNHGMTFSLQDQPVEGSYAKSNSRYMLVDDHTEEPLSIFELENALKRTGQKLDMIYWDMCLMNCIENLCQIGEYTRYVMGSANVTPGIGGNYAQLMESLDNHADLPTAMKEYVPATVGLWKSTKQQRPVDLELYDMEHLDGVIQAAKNYTDDFLALQNSLEKGSQQDLLFQYLNGSDDKESDYYKSDDGVLYYFKDGKGYVDMLSAFTRFGSSSLNGSLATDANKLKLAFDKFIVTEASNLLPDYLKHVSVSINWLPTHLFTASDDELQITQFNQLYTTLKFDKQVGWSNFLKNNDWRLVEFNEEGELVEINHIKWNGRMSVLNVEDYSGNENLLNVIDAITQQSLTYYAKPSDAQAKFEDFLLVAKKLLAQCLDMDIETPLQFKADFICEDDEALSLSHTFTFPDSSESPDEE